MSSRHVLIVDDHREVRRALRAGLLTLNQDIEIIDVPSAEEALLVLSRQRVDLMVLDVRLPGISGLELQTRLRRRDLFVKLILISGVTEAKTRQAISESGADAVFFKPIQMDQFLETARSFLNLEASDEIGKAAETRVEPPDLPLVLSGFLKEFNAAGVILLGDRGDTLAQVGRINELEYVPGLPIAIQGAISGLRQIADLLGIVAPQDIVRLEGQWNTLYLALVDPSSSLLVALPKGAPSEQVLRLPTSTWDLVRRLGDLLNEARNPALENKSPPIESVGGGVADELEGDASPEFLGLFDREAEIEANRNLAETFWEMPEELSNPNLAGESGVITFEEAQRRGLAPESDGGV